MVATEVLTMVGFFLCDYHDSMRLTITQGADFPNLELVIWWGTSETLVIHLQRMGRGGRSKKINKCHAITVVTANQYVKATQMHPQLAAQSPKVKAEESEGSSDSQDALGDAVDKDFTTGERGSRSDNVEGDNQTHRVASAPRSNSKQANEPQELKPGKKRVRSRVLDVEVVWFIATNTC